jgi:hypothetical protein
MLASMTSWDDFTGAEPDLAARARSRFEAHGLALMATIRADGSPRLSGIEPLFTGGELWLAMMPGGRKSDDLRRDPRLALHNATTDKAVTDGDVKVSGRVVAVADPDTVGRYVAAFERATGAPPPPGPFDLWRVDVTEVAMIAPGDDHLVVETWRPGRPRQRIERR